MDGVQNLSSKPPLPPFRISLPTTDTSLPTRIQTPILLVLVIVSTILYAETMEFLMLLDVDSSVPMWLCLTKDLVTISTGPNLLITIVLVIISSLQCVDRMGPVSYTHLRAHETPEHLVCRLLLEKKK